MLAEHAARPARRPGGRGRRGTVPLLRRGRRSSRARCCSSTADWGCSDGRRSGTDSDESSSPGSATVTPLGNDVETTWDSLIAGESGAGPITQFDATDYAVALRLRGEGLRRRRTGSTASRRGAWTASRRWRSPRRGRPRRTPGLDIAADAGPRRRGGRDRDRRPQVVRGLLPAAARARAPTGSNPFSIVQIIPNMAAGWVSMELGDAGPLSPSARPARRRTWRSATGSTRSGSAAPT